MRIGIYLLAFVTTVYSQTAFADEVLRGKISAAFKSCGETAGLTKATAPAIIIRCKKALETMNGLHGVSQSDEFDKSWLDFNGGAVLILLAAAYAVENDNKLNKDVCQSAINADRIWSKVKAKPGSKLESDIKNDELFHSLVPPCKKAYGIN